MIKLFDVPPTDASRAQREALRDVVEAIEAAHRHHRPADEIEDIASTFVEGCVLAALRETMLNHSMPPIADIEKAAASLGRGAVAHLRNVGAWDLDWGTVDAVTARAAEGHVSLAITGELWRRRSARELAKLVVTGTLDA